MTVSSFLTDAFPTVWGAWGLFWLLASGWSAPTIERLRPGARSVHLVFVLAGSGLLIASPSPGSSLGHPLFAAEAWTAFLGLGLTLSGLAFTTWARVALGRMWSGPVTLKAGHVIIDRGPYAVARHPIYTGLLLALLGTAAARGTVAGLLGFALVAIGLVLKLRQEERLLLGHFGAAYAEYRGRVKGLIPLVW